MDINDPVIKEKIKNRSTEIQRAFDISFSLIEKKREEIKELTTKLNESKKQLFELIEVNNVINDRAKELNCQHIL